MATALTGQLKIEISGQQTNTVDFGQTTFPYDYALTWSFVNGTGANQANQLFTDTRTLADGATENLDLAGTLADAFGNTVAFARVKGLILEAIGTNTTNLTFGNGTTPWPAPFGTTGELVLKPGHKAAFICPDATAWPVTGTSADIFKVTNGSGAEATYKIVILGASA